MYDSRDNNYILYGFGELGKKVLHKLWKNNINVVAILDKHASEDDNWGGVPIFPPNTIKLSRQNKEESVVIICLNAGMEHYCVAENLYSLGFKKIIFLPLMYALPYEKKIKLTNLYNKALHGIDVGNEIEEYCKYKRKDWSDWAVIRHYEREKLVWIGQEILFSEDKARWKGDISKIHTVNNGIDVNFNCYYWNHDLFNYLDGFRSDCDSYLSVLEITPNSEKDTLKLLDRENLFSFFKKELANGLEYFIEAAPEVMWNEKGYFNIVGGNHRTSFLQHQGYVFYPVRMTEEDYKVWKNESRLSDVVEYIEKNDIKCTYVPIPHPCFKIFPYLREEWGNTVLSDVLNLLGPIRLEGVKVIDASQYEGYFARVATRMCADKVIYYNEEDKILGLVERLFNLLYIQDVDIISDSNILRHECEQSDIIFGMLNTKKLLEMGCLRMFSGKLFSEFWTDNDTFVEDVLKKTKLKHYTVLQRRVFQCKMLEVGVFEV